MMEFQSINKLFEKSIREHWERPALSNYQGETMTYANLAKRIEYLHIGFEKCGLKKGEKAAICSKNQANWGVCFLAALTYGAVPVPILHEFKPENIHYLVNHSEAKVLFVDEQIWENLSESEMTGLQMIIQINDMKIVWSKNKSEQKIRASILEGFRKRFPDGVKPEDLNYHEDKPEELAIINYTSGTSGFSKGVMIPYRALWTVNYTSLYVAEPQMKCDSDIVAMLPSAHMYGLMFDLVFGISIGSHVHFLTRIPSPKIIMKAFSEIHPGIIIAVPLIIEKVYKSAIQPVLEKNKTFLKIPILDHFILKKIHDEMTAAFGNTFEEVIIGGAAFNPEVESFLRKINFRFTVGYGMTECGPLITYAKWSESRQGSCGKPIPGCEIRIDSSDPYTVPGEVLVKGSNVFLGYFKNEKATKDVFTEDGWFRTGDIGVVDKDGYLYLRGRSKCMILGPSGQNIYPEELEAVINNVRSVVDSLVVEDDGGLTAIVFPDYHQAEKEGLSREAFVEKLAATLPEINKQLPAYAQIRKIEFLPEDFERTPKRSIKRYLYQR